MISMNSEIRKNHIFITGASRGLGWSLAKVRWPSRDSLYLLARGALPLENHGERKDTWFFPADVQNIEQTLSTINEIFSLIYKEFGKGREQQGLILFQNVGVVEPIGFVGQIFSEDIIRNLHVNLLAPMLIANRAMALFQDLALPMKRVVFISSGAAESIYAGWSCYGAAKAGLNQFMKNMAKEQEGLPYPFSVASISPGAMSGRMQEQIRAVSETEFPMRRKFVDLFRSGQLVDPDMAAQQIMQWSLGQDFVNGSVLSLRDLLMKG